MRNLLQYCAVLGAMIFASVCLGQDQEAAIKLRLAQNFEQSGDWEKAVPLYESLYLSNPQNFVYFEGLRRGFIQLKQYDKAIDLIQYWFSFQKPNPSLLAELGGIYYQKGEEAKADSIWQSIIKSDPKNPGLYRQVASQLMEFRLYDQAIQVFLEARRATGNEEQFTDELAGLYSAFQQYDAATKEYVSMLRARPQQLQSIQARMSSFVVRPEAIKIVHRVLDQEVARRNDFIPLRRLFAWVLMEEKDYESASAEFRTIDKLANAAGGELFNFGRQASMENAFGPAARAFKEVIDRYPASPQIPFARLGYARALEELSDTVRAPGSSSPTTWPVSETRPSYGTVLSLYEAIIVDFPRSEFAAQSSFRIGVLKRDRLLDLDGSLTAFENVKAMLPSSALAREASLNAGQVLLLKNNLPGARSEYSKLLHDASVDIQQQALLALAEVDYYEALYDSAASKLISVAAVISNDLANDALQFLYFIQENRQDSAALAAFGRADLLMRQHKHSEALEGFKECVSRFPRANLIDDALMKVGELQLVLKKTEDALKTFRSVLGMALSILRDRAQMRIGEVYETVLSDNQKAIDAYEELLVKFPHSLYAEKARLRIRLLRGDVL